MRNGFAVIIVFILYSTTSLSQVILLDEDFQLGTLPTGWSQTTNATDGGWLLGTNTSLQSVYWPIAPHGNFIATNDDECDCDKSEDYLITPPIDLTGISAAVMQFQNYFDGESMFGGTETATVEYSVDGGASWNVLQTIIGVNNGLWDAQTVSLNALIGNSNVLIGFHYYDDFNWLFGWAIDDVFVSEVSGLDLGLSSLSVPTTLSTGTTTPVTGIVTNTGLDTIQSFDVSWTIGSSVFNTNISGLSIPSLGTYNFSHPDLLEINTSGMYSLEVSIGNVNGQPADSNATNDNISADITVAEYGTISSGGFSRDYIYYHASSASSSCPLVMVFHGYSGNAQDIMDYSAFNALAEEYGFAVCYPQGTEDSFNTTFWNVGYDFQSGETVNDVAFVNELIDTLSSQNSLSDENIFSTGMSNGGDFSYMLACESSETFKGIAPVAGMMLQHIIDTCNQVREVSIFEIHGTNDNVTPMAGDPTNIDGWGAYPSIPNTMDYWVTRYGLTTTTSSTLPDIDPADGSNVYSDKYTETGSCSQVWLYTVNGGGHDWPGAYGNMDISASREAWLFFDQLCVNPLQMIEFEKDSNRQLLRIVDLLGREIPYKNGTIMLYQYSDGSVEKKFVLD
ncbi:dienelactone hydrolase family protein [Flavobacteriales bacterium]|nr:dienelactone hydrolase family protein [Flavobacteriales bacterium]